MSERNYEVEEFKTRGETRWRIVDKETGKVLDDAQGWGYKSRQNAHIGWSYNRKSDAEKEKDYQRKLAVWKFLHENKKLNEDMEYEAFYAMKDGEDFGEDEVRGILEYGGIETEYSAKEILKAWENGRPKKPGHMKKAENAEKAVKKLKGWKEKEYEKNLEAWNWVKEKSDLIKAIKRENAAFRAEHKKYTGTEVKVLFAKMGLKTDIKARRILKAVLRGTPPPAPKEKENPKSAQK